MKLLRLLDLLAFAGILHSYWGIDIATGVPLYVCNEAFCWMPVGWYILLMYAQGVLGAFWLYLRVWRD